MKALSFDSACEMLNRKKDEDGNWSSSTNGFQGEDVKIRRCDILYDMYTISYGKVRNTAIPEATIQSWIDDGYINYDVNKPTLNKDIRTEKGKESNEVYVYSIQSQTKDSMKDDEGKDITYNKFTCTVIEYKMLGYSSFPVHLFGTDDKGRDVLKYSFSGLRTSLLLGVIVALINITFGLIWGSISGYFGGWTDLAMERIVEVLSGIPWIILMTVISIKLGSSAFSFGLALCLTGWIGTESVTREQFYRYKDREYVLAAKTLGAKSPRLIFRHILPNAIGTIITSSVLIIPSTIFSEATIAFLGLGLKNVASLGVILSTYEGSVSSYPYQMAVPAVIISLLMICFNLFGNGLRDAFNPSLKGAE
jgi:oligopeptide transport system permease protein